MPSRSASRIGGEKKNLYVPTSVSKEGDSGVLIAALDALALS